MLQKTTLTAETTTPTNERQASKIEQGYPWPVFFVHPLGGKPGCISRCRALTTSSAQPQYSLVFLHLVQKPARLGTGHPF